MAEKKRVERIGDILSRVIRRLGIEKKLKEGSLFSAWDEEVGKEIARHAQPAYIKRGRLTVFVESSVYIQEYLFLKDELIKKLNARMGRGFVREIVFRVGEIKKQ